MCDIMAKTTGMSRKMAK